ncbi:MAG: hypothetical protein O9346_16915 [Leptospiraceae bacterium]|nr:hypothetical protein [Leptospiraceae bacterium]MCZ8348095.1 hypothetical protein [Leptospiraceae bacterium]
MKNKSRSLSFLLLFMNFFFLEACVAWPGLTAVFSMLQSKASSSPPILLFPGSNQSQDNASNSDNTANIIPPGGEVIPINPSPASPELVIDQRTSWMVSESGTKIIFRAKLSEQPSQNVQFNSIVLSQIGEVSIGPSSLTFTPGNWNIDQEVEVTGLADSIQDGNQLVEIQLNQSISADPLFNGLEGGIVSVLNVDIDIAGISVTPLSSVVTSEAGSFQNISVVLNSKPTSNVSFPIIVSDSTEVSASTGVIHFTPSNWNTIQVIALTGLDDSSIDGDVSYLVQLGSSTSADPIYSGMSSGTINGINLDNDTAGIIVNTASLAPLLTSESGGAISYSIRLSSQPNANVTLSVFSLSPSEGQPSVSTLTFTNLNWNTNQSLVVTGQDDFDIDGDKAYTIQIFVSSSVDTHYSSLLPVSLGFINIDNDSAGFIFQNHISKSTSEDGTNTSFQMKLRSRPTANVTIHLLSSDTSEGVVSPSSLTFTPTNWNSFRTVTITSVNESLIDGDQHYEIQFPSVLSSDANYDSLSVGSVPVVNLDDDTPGVMFMNTTSMLTTESNSTGWTFQVRLKTKPISNVTMPLITVSNSNEGSLSITTIEFSPTDWNVPRSIKITPVRDFVADGDVTYSIDFQNLVSADPLYNHFIVNSLSVLNRNSDTRGYIYNPSSPLLFVTDSGREDSFTIRLNSKPEGIVRLPITSYDTSEMNVISSSTIEFNASNWNTPVPIQVKGVEDFALDGTKSARLGIGVESGVSNGPYFPVSIASVSDQNYDTLALTDRNGGTRGILTVRACDAESLLSICASRAPAYQTTEAGGTVSLFYSLGQAPTQNVTLTISSTNPSEGISNQTSLVFTSLNWRDLQEVIFTGQDDFAIDGTINYNIEYTLSSSDGTFHGLVVPPTAFRNADNDSAGLVLNATNSSTSPYITTRVAGPNQSYSFSIRLSAQPSGPVSFPIVSSMTNQGILNVNLLSFDPTNWNTPQWVTVTSVDNGSTNIQNYNLVAGPFTSTDTKFSVLPNRNIFMRNVSPGFTLTPPSTQTGEWGLTSSFRLNLNSPPADTVTFRYYSELETEGIPITGTSLAPSNPLYPLGLPAGTTVRSFTRTAANWNANTSYTVRGVDDETLDGDMNYRIIFLPVISNDLSYDGLVPDPITFSNIDND